METKRLIGTTTWRVALLAGLMMFAQFALALERCDVSPAADGCVAQCVTADEAASSLDQPLNSFAAPAPRVVADFTLPVVRVSSVAPCDAPLHAGRTLQILYCSYQT